jgi:hypothetical protein
MINAINGSVIVHTLLVASVVSCSAQNVHNRYSEDEIKDANANVQQMFEKMPLWEADKLGQFERQEITLVEVDVAMCQADTDVNEFMEDYNHMLTDYYALEALDESLKTRDVI